jgi:hypothetical protein
LLNRGHDFQPSALDELTLFLSGIKLIGNEILNVRALPHSRTSRKRHKGPPEIAIIDETERPAWLKRADEAFRNDDATAISRMIR